MKLKLCLRCVAAAVLVAFFVGCEGDWTSGGGAESWNDRYNWVNFSGVYRGIGGGVLVTDYSATPGTPGVTNSITDERIGTGNGSSTTYSGVLAKSPLVAGTLSIRAGGFVFSDNGDGSLSGTSGTTGAIDYSTGAWSIDLLGMIIAPNEPILASYQYTVSGSAGTGSPGRGSTKFTIFSFVVHQEGEKLTITDNMGKEYVGRFGSVRATSGASVEIGVPPTIGDTVVAQYEASGVSAAGLHVQMVGTFQGVVGADNMLTERKIFGTWIERDGRTGDINGESSPIPISSTSTTGTTGTGGGGTP